MSLEFINDLVKNLFTVQLSVKIYHWNTTSYAKHKATDQFTSNLLSLTDKFVELFIGRYKYKPNVKDVNIYNNDINKILEKLRTYLSNMDNIIKDTDLLTVRDELVGEINQTLYLLQLE